MPKGRSSSTTSPAEDEFKNHAVANFLGVKIISVTRKKVMAEMNITPSHINRAGRVGGGMIMAFADILGARGTVANLPAGARTSTIESKSNFFAAGAGPKLIAVSLPLHIGRTTMVWQTTVSNADKKKVAVVTQTQIVIPARKQSLGSDPKEER
jgi:uncharacterized protein (TIGR00369 family)